ncbi:hypothetical protein [Actinoplanes teichomyceticus]|uniref:Uncharacterized protein n=1 Tax=Actinoplanes teichomyceticus TaxID=1867 RepID=A0A561VS23_ACTTI|nr:hypothetical protein [Actinoplanes teichomyceticus]TWG14401.1 hypothetical protein FHX34_104701 [Actinoplanes teichomyceticus]GIF13038.1 hypothetical protein Ate01nite_30700 [Actinoplanes teichomyceticus]
MSDEQPERTPAGSLYTSAAATESHRRSMRRKQAVVGVTGAAAVLAGAGFLVGQLMESEQETLPEPAALPPLTTAATGGSEGTRRSAVPVTRHAFRTTRPAAPARRTPSPTPEKPAAEIARSAAAGGLPLRSAASATADRVRGTVTRRVETFGNQTVRVTSAHTDLSGHPELSLAADRGHPVADGVRCTDRVRPSAGASPGTGDRLLLCWRTSAERSVVTMTVATRGAPDETDSVAIIDREWAALE